MCAEERTPCQVVTMAGLPRGAAGRQEPTGPWMGPHRRAGRGHLSPGSERGVTRKAERGHEDREGRRTHHHQSPHEGKGAGASLWGEAAGLAGPGVWLVVRGAGQVGSQGPRTGGGGGKSVKGGVRGWPRAPSQQGEAP
ncbi:hypothetical protein HJG60_011449 [Phyllostomus discolor]|uniref:Uncharacterized protein n=1 Tax=Phyllostomus discolor TaxID=89673 RepID=A0A834E7W6_9CHIR|nr:hypothetical protein HJG60_011449 [Phyllostomus discolor]